MRDERKFSVGFAQSVKNGMQGYLIVARNVLLVGVWINNSSKIFLSQVSLCKKIDSQYLIQVLILLTENHGTINKIAPYLHVCVVWAESSLFVLYQLAYLITDKC